jgi:hypothetical protein
MPRFTLHDGTGTGYRIDSTDLSLVQAWLYHWTPRLAGNGPMTLTVRPVRDHAGVPDWPADPRSYTERFEVAADPGVIMERIARRRQELSQPSAAAGSRSCSPRR